MTYRHAFAGDAARDWQKLTIGLQEAVLDELDRLCESPSFPPAETQVIHDFIVDTPQARHVVFLYLVINHASGQVTVLSVGHFSDP